MGKLLLLFLLVPAAELALLIELGRHIGTLPTLGIVAGTGILGALLARRQGLSALEAIRRELAAGTIPAGPIADGVMILLAGALLMTPGLITDTVGFLCLLPTTRRCIRRFLWARLAEAVRSGRVKVSVSVRSHPDGRDEPGGRLLEPPEDPKAD